VNPPNVKNSITVPIICNPMVGSFWNIDNVSVSDLSFFLSYSYLALSVDNIMQLFMIRADVFRKKGWAATELRKHT